jgi:hypothetical protein
MTPYPDSDTSASFTRPALGDPVYLAREHLPRMGRGASASPVLGDGRRQTDTPKLRVLVVVEHDIHHDRLSTDGHRRHPATLVLAERAIGRRPSTTLCPVENPQNGFSQPTRRTCSIRVTAGDAGDTGHASPPPKHSPPQRLNCHRGRPPNDVPGISKRPFHLHKPAPRP